jgi:hypothetical protein
MIIRLPRATLCPADQKTVYIIGSSCCAIAQRERRATKWEKGEEEKSAV